LVLALNPALHRMLWPQACVHSRVFSVVYMLGLAL
jgi:hypothetical protein